MVFQDGVLCHKHSYIVNAAVAVTWNKFIGIGDDR